jgi:hypothetical protein
MPDFKHPMIMVFWMVGPIFYISAVIVLWFFPTFDWQLVRYIPIPEFQYRTNVLVPLGDGTANRYAVICFALTTAFFIQTLATFLTNSRSKTPEYYKQSLFQKFDRTKRFLMGCALNFVFCYITFFAPEIIIAGKSKMAILYNETDLKFFVYWGLSLFVSVQLSTFLNGLFTLTRNLFAKKGQK